MLSKCLFGSVDKSGNEPTSIKPSIHSSEYKPNSSSATEYQVGGYPGLWLYECMHWVFKCMHSYTRSAGYAFLVHVFSCIASMLFWCLVNVTPRNHKASNRLYSLVHRFLLICSCTLALPYRDFSFQIHEHLQQDHRLEHLTPRPHSICLLSIKQGLLYAYKMS